MKIPILHYIQRSLANRITLWVVLCVLVILTVTDLVGNHYVAKSIKLEERVKANGILYIMGQRIDSALVSVEVAMRNRLGDIRERLNEQEALYHITQRILEDNPSIVGSAIAFCPNYFPKQGKWFAPYSYREGNVIMTKQLGNADYDYHTMDWYHTADSLKHEYWSEPYYDEGGGELLMTTYSCPLTDEAGNVIAVVTADIMLEELSKLLDVKSIDNAYVCMISRSGTFISYPDREQVLRETVFSMAEDNNLPELKELGQEMIEGKSGVREWNSPTWGDYHIFYVPLQHTGWSMAMVCKATELFKGLYVTASFLSVLYILMIILLILLLRRAIYRLISPLTMFTQAVDEVAQGNLNAPLPDTRSKDEMQRLHHSFSTMQQSLVQQMEELREVNEAKGRIEGELKVARDIQLSMLPKEYVPAANNNCLDIYGQLISAKEVGGDFYDFFIRDKKLFFCIGDVSGKGVPASLVMAMTLSQFRNVACYEDDLQEIIRSINETRCDGNDTMLFVTFFMGVLDVSSGRLQYCNAGHNKPFVVSSGVTELPAKPDLPLGISDEVNYVVREESLPIGATLFLYTDGLTEAKSEQQELFGVQRLTDTLKGGVSCERQIKDTTQAVRQFVGTAPQNDDLTMLAIRYVDNRIK